MTNSRRASPLAALSAAMLLAATFPALSSAPAKPGVKRCALLQSQLTAAARSKHMVLPQRVKSLEAEAQQFCANGKPAQGNRSYVKALTALGIKPEFEADKEIGDWK